MFTITADSTPVLDTWGFADYWSKEDWQNWHSQMVKKYGTDYAKQKFLYWWNQQDSFANPYNWAKYDKNFVNYLDKYRIDISSIASRATVGLENVQKNVIDTASTSSKALKYAVPALIIVGAVLLVAYGYKKVKIA